MEEEHDLKPGQGRGGKRRHIGILVAVIVVGLLAFPFALVMKNTLLGVETQSEPEGVLAANVQMLEELEQQAVPDVYTLNSEQEQAAAEVEEGSAVEETNTEETGTEETSAEETSTEETGTEETGTEEAGTEEAGTEEAGTEEAGTGENSSVEENNTEGTGAETETVVFDMAAEQQKIMTMENPDNSTLLTWFSGCAIVGDSIVAGVTEYQLLDNSIVFGKVGISVYGSDDLIAAMEAVFPRKVFLCFGLNDMSHYGENVEKFIENYRPRIEKIKTDLPSADIYLVAVNPVQEVAIVNNAKMAYVSLYNQRLEQFAAEMGVGFINPSFILEQDTSYYGSDGMHLSGGFYYKWLTYLADMAGLSS